MGHANLWITLVVNLDSYSALICLTPRLVNAVPPERKSYGIDVANIYRLGRSMVLDWIAACFRLPGAADLPVVGTYYKMSSTT